MPIQTLLRCDKILRRTRWQNARASEGAVNEWNQINQIHNIQQKYLVKWSSAELLMLLFVAEAIRATAPSPTEAVILTNQVKLSHSENYTTHRDERWEIWACLWIFCFPLFDKLLRASKADADVVADDINSSMKIELLNSKKAVWLN